MKKIAIYICKILEYINKLIPKSNKKIVFYSNLGFRDNSEALFDYLILNNYQESYEIIIASNDYKEIKKVDNVKYVNCVVGLYYFLTSKYFFYSFGKYPIMPSKSQVVVNLWHGMPLKKIGNMEKGKEKNKYDYFNYVLSTSSYFDEIMSKSFNCSLDRILHCGQPRTDIFFSKITKKNKIFKGYDQILIWMPTFRNSDIIHESNSSNDDKILPLISSYGEMNFLNNILIEYNSLLVIKLHPIQSKQGLSFGNLSNIVFIDEKFLKDNNTSLYSFLRETDCLITDYSSVYFDYLLLQKPIIFTNNDIDDYKENRGLNFNNLEDIMPGACVKTFNDLINKIKDNLRGNDYYSEKRRSVNYIVNEYSNINNCEFICNFIGLKKEKIYG
ncbi:CDP-glycerol glycerophosphotransferase family protein [uncultured Anaerococcus sp.]|uniref:CDP-glycerol glycerophosphotransferase family protein n=1 Tax=uncultured Anaerococcus sp. TaxID=293428 RepID=UPI00288C3334|nr:CDP-glycerol glycerophosphotransferase family protein [uncultured Anaerococcus sp.]